MNVYVLGAGVSRKVGYPLGYELLGAVDCFVRKHSREINRFQFSEWPSLCARLEENKNTLVRLAYKFGHFEQLLTVLDQYKMITDEFIIQNINIRKKDRARAERLGQEFDTYMKDSNVQDRNTLLFALAEFLQYRHHEDQLSFGMESWSDLKLFGEKLENGDRVITFNYDSCVERVLLAQGKWSPKNGYGFPVEFNDEAETKGQGSNVTVLHLHSATGWYKTPAFYTGWDRTISLDPLFLSCLDFPYFDTSLPEVSNEAEIIIYPTYMKTYELGGTSDTALINLWRAAADSLRKAEKIFIIGYSLPQADSAALSLLLGNCDPEKIRVVNSDMATSRRLSRLFGRKSIAPPLSFEEWVKAKQSRFTVGF